MMMEFSDLFRSIDRFLFANQEIWRYQSFRLATQSHDVICPWRSTYPELDYALNELTDSDVQYFRAQENNLLNWISPHIPGLSELHQLCRFDANDVFPCSSVNLDDISSTIYCAIPGRKIEQIKAFSRIALAQHSGNGWLEWCAGKGYLGRVIASVNQEPVLSFEYQQALCDAGSQYAKQHVLPITFVQGDAFQPASQAIIPEHSHAMALHACGDLHVTLLQYCVARKLPAVSIAPCCYHLIRSEKYQPMSSHGISAKLKLTKDELRIPLQETVTGGNRVRHHRQSEMIYRLGFDLILKIEFGEDNYFSVPSIKKSLLSEGFEAFCLLAAQHTGHQLIGLDFAKYLRMAEKKFWQMERLSMVQQAFFRIIETWIVLDKVLYLQENNYQVSLSRFCDKAITPRNLFIHGKRAE